MILRIRSSVKQIIRQCGQCRHFIASPFSAKMSLNLEEWLLKYEKPFSSTGLDYFLFSHDNKNFNICHSLDTCYSPTLTSVQVNRENDNAYPEFQVQIGPHKEQSHSFLTSSMRFSTSFFGPYCSFALLPRYLSDDTFCTTASSVTGCTCTVVSVIPETSISVVFIRKPEFSLCPTM